MLVVCGLLVSAPYWLGPVRVWMNQRSLVPDWEILPGNGIDALPLDVRRFFADADRALADLGFSPLAVIRDATSRPSGYRTWRILYGNRREKTRAGAFALIPSDPLNAVRPKPSLYFVTNFADGRKVEVGCSSHVHIFADVPGRVYRQFPEARDPRLLYRIHRVLLEPFFDAPRDFPAAGAEVEYSLEATIDVYRRQVEAGYMREVEPDRSYRPTVWGAMLMTWKLLPPMSWIALERRRRANRAFLAEHGLLDGTLPAARPPL